MNYNNLSKCTLLSLSLLVSCVTKPMQSNSSSASTTKVEVAGGVSSRKEIEKAQKEEKKSDSKEDVKKEEVKQTKVDVSKGTITEKPGR